jgi:hypothetical protein
MSWITRCALAPDLAAEFEHQRLRHQATREVEVLAHPLREDAHPLGEEDEPRRRC